MGKHRSLINGTRSAHRRPNTTVVAIAKSCFEKTKPSTDDASYDILLRRLDMPTLTL